MIADTTSVPNNTRCHVITGCLDEPIHLVYASSCVRGHQTTILRGVSSTSTSNDHSPRRLCNVNIKPLLSSGGSVTGALNHNSPRRPCDVSIKPFLTATPTNMFNKELATWFTVTTKTIRSQSGQKYLPINKFTTGSYEEVNENDITAAANITRLRLSSKEKRSFTSPHPIPDQVCPEMERIREAR